MLSGYEPITALGADHLIVWGRCGRFSKKKIFPADICEKKILPRTACEKKRWQANMREKNQPSGDSVHSFLQISARPAGAIIIL